MAISSTVSVAVSRSVFGAYFGTRLKKSLALTLFAFWCITASVVPSQAFETQSFEFGLEQPLWDAPMPGFAASQDDVIKAQRDRKRLHFVVVPNAEVVQVMPDDLRGRKHQKWEVKLSNGKTMMAVYNIDLAERVPMRVGDTMTLAGEYIWDQGGGLIHWLHGDPRGRRPDGYVELNGVVYGKVH